MHGTGVGVADLNQVIQILVSGLTGERAREFHEVLQRGAVDPTFNECLATLFQVADPSVALAPLGQFVLPPTIGWNHLREISGLTLKNNIIRHASTLGPTCVFQIGQQACAVLSHADVRLVRTAGQIIAAITRRFGLDLWQKGATNPMVGTDSGPHDLMQHLSALAHHGNPSAFIALRYLFEDAHNALGSFTQDILFMVCHNALRCIEAIECLVAAYEVGVDLIWPMDLCAMTEFQIGLWNSSEAAARTATTILSHNIPVVVRQGLLRLMRFMLAYREAFVLPPEIANTWVQCILHLFADTAYFPECCGFLTEICHVASEVEDLSDLQQDIFLVHITPQHIAQIVPVLLARMAYSDEEADEMLEQDSIRIRDLHVRPRACNNRGRKKAFSGDMVTDAVESHHQGDNEDVVAATVRTAALNCLQGFSLIHPNAVWFELRSVIQRRLEDADWKMRESSLLALGAVTHGCFRLLRKDFPSITTLVYERAASDAHVLVRCTACWLISSSLSLLVTIDGTHDKVNQGFQVILSCSLQESKRLQWASISSLQCMMVELMRYSRSHFDEIVPAFAETLPQLASQCQTNNLMLLLELFDGLIHAYPQLPYQAFLQVLFGRLEEARCALPEHPESVVVREMLYIFAPIANLLQNGLLLPAEAIEQLANMALQCIQHYIEHSDTVDADFFVYAIHLFSVLLHVNPEKYAGQHMANIHAHILNTTLLSNGHEVVVAALLYLEKMVMIYGGKSAIVANQSSQLNGMASDGSEGILTSAPGVFMAAFETNIYPRLLQLASRQHDHMAECDAIWTLGQCLIHLQKVLNPSWCQQSILSLLNDLVRRISEGVEQVVRRISVLQDGAGESNLDQNSSKLDVSRILLNLSERVDLLSEDEIICTSVQTLMNVVRSSHDATVLDSFVKAAFPFFLSGTKEDSSINHHTLVICTIMMTVQRLPNDPYKAASMVGIVRLLSLILPHVPLASEALSCLVYLIAKHFFLAAQSFHETVPHPHNEVRESVRTMLVEILNAPNSSLGSVCRQFLDSTPPIAQKIQRQYLA